MAANVYGLPGNEPGDKQVFETLKNLPSGWLVYAQPKIIKDREEKNPDYVLLHQDLGYIVLEVKDYVSVENPDAKGCWVERRSRQDSEWEPSPVEQAKKAAELIERKLAEDETLRNFKGKLDFSYRYAGVLPHLPSHTISWLGKSWGDGKVLGISDLSRDSILKKITSIPAPFTARLTQTQFDCVRAILDDANAVLDRAGQKRGIYSVEQEEIAKSPYIHPFQIDKKAETEKQVDLWGDISVDLEKRKSHLEEDAPDEVLSLYRAQNIKLVRGRAGTGKTDVLVMRARYLYDMYQDIQILVTTFNVPLVEERLKPELEKHKDRVDVFTFDMLCKEIYTDRVSQWPNIQDVGGVVKKLENNGADDIPDLIQKYGAEFVEQEINWMKDSGLRLLSAYLSTRRSGRAKSSGKILSSPQKRELFQIFSAYQKRLEDLRAYDWPDMHQKVLEFLQDGSIPKKQYDAVFIDEAQHFAPAWFKIVLAHLNPSGSIFMCEDPSQSVYRLYSWEQKGIPVIGRTRWLRIPYRSTREIFRAAYSLISTNELAKSLLGEEEASPDVDNPNIRSGNLPEVHEFSSLEKQKEFICARIQSLTQTVLPSEIAILHTEKHVRDTFKSLVPPGVKIDDIKRRTGLEYKFVFIPQVQKLFESEQSFDYERTVAEHQLVLYTAMTRARDMVYLTFGHKWPKEYEILEQYVNWHKPD